MKNQFPNVKFVFDNKVETKIAISFAINNAKFAKRFLPSHLRFVLRKNFSPEEKKKIITAYVKDYYNQHAAQLEGQYKIIQKDWKGVENKFFAVSERIFNSHPWPKGKYIGFGTIFWIYPRWISNKTFLFPLNHSDSHYARKVTGHELLHFIFFDYVKKHFKLEEDNGHGHLWKVSEAFNSVIEGWPPYQKIFHCTPNPYPETMEIYLKMKKQWKQRQDIIWLLDKWLT